MKRIIVILSTFCCWLTAMDAPPSAPASAKIPVELQLKYAEERDRFRSYKLDDPEAKFLPHLREELKKVNASKSKLLPRVRKELKKLDNPEVKLPGLQEELEKALEHDEDVAYLDNLNIFANLLLAQHFMLNKAADINYLNQELKRLKTNEKQYLHALGATTDVSGQRSIAVHPPDIDTLNEIITHRSLIEKQTGTLSPEESQIVFNWLFDEHINPWMKTLAKNRLLLILIPAILNQRYAQLNLFDAQLNQILLKLQSRYTKLPKIIQRNTAGIAELYSAYQKAQARFNNYSRKEVQNQNTLNSLGDDYFDQVASAGYLYEYTHKWYEQLYQIIRNEIKATMAQLLKSDPAKLKTLNSPAVNFFTNVYNENSLPAALPPFVNSELTITLPTLVNEQEHAKKIWNEQQRKREEERKRNNKIKEIPNDSYALEFENTPTSITIHNIKNNTQEIIFKHEHSYEIERSGTKIPPINYTNWVKEWFANPLNAIKMQGYADRQSVKFTPEKDYWKPIALHAFSPLVDEYIQQWGRATTIKNRRNPAQQDILITIPGKMIYPSGSQPAEEPGIFAYIIDSKNGQWYHRMFTPGTLSELTKNLFEKGYFAPDMTGYYDVFFPALPGRKK